MAAYNVAMAATTAMDAQAEANKAKAQNAIATAQHTGDDGAGMKYMAAKDAAMKAEMAADVHVLGLLRAANDVTETDNDDRVAAVRAVASAVASAAGTADDGDNDGDTTDGSGTDSVTATWVADTQDDPATPDDNEFVAGQVVVTVTGVGDAAIASDTMGVDANDDGDTADAGDTMPNAKPMTVGLPKFMYGFEISARDAAGMEDGRHVIVFTDIEQAEAAAGAVFLEDPVVINNRPAVASRVVVAEDATTLAGATYDHDGNPDTAGLTATYACGSAQATDCSFEIVGGKVTALRNYVVSVSIDATAAASFELDCREGYSSR